MDKAENLIFLKFFLAFFCILLNMLQYLQLEVLRMVQMKPILRIFLANEIYIKGVLARFVVSCR